MGGTAFWLMGARGGVGQLSNAQFPWGIAPKTLAKVRVNQGWTVGQLTHTLRCEDDAPPTPGRTDFYYARVIQRNGQRAWSSPIWVEG
jgi:hypothetical protein